MKLYLKLRKIEKKSFYQGFIILLEILAKTWFLIGILILGYILFTEVDQANDILFGLIYDSSPLIKNLKFFGFTIIWSLATWYAFREVLWLVYFTNVKKKNFYNRAIYKGFIIWMPRIFSIVVYLIMIVALCTSIIKSSKGNPNKSDILIHIAILAILAFATLLFVSFRREWFKQTDYFAGIFNNITKGNYIKKKSRSIDKWLLRALLFSMIVIILFSIRPLGVTLSIILGPVSIILLAFSCWSMVGALLTWIDNKISIPLNFFILIMIIFFSINNNNDQINYLGGGEIMLKKTDKRDNLINHFQKWYSFKKSNTSVNKNIYIIAGEGGGSRASYWSSGVMNKLYRTGIYDNIYAFSTVSGSSVGVGFFNSYCKDTLLKYPNVLENNDIRKISGGDYLSPITAALLFPEVLQGIWPFGMKELDRAKYLEDAFSAQYFKIAKKNTLEDDYLSLWKEKYEIPLHLINTTVVESGQKAVISPILWEEKNSIDLLCNLDHPIALKTAMALSARFPVFTSPGTVQRNKRDYFNLSDGGYYENTGLETALEVYEKLVELRQKDSTLIFNVNIIYLQNNDSVNYSFEGPLNFLDLASIPLASLYNTWSNESAPMIQLTQRYLGKVNLAQQKKDTLLVFDLSYKNSHFPLSRYLSDTLKSVMNKQLDSIVYSKEYEIIQQQLKDVYVVEDDSVKIKGIVESTNF